MEIEQELNKNICPECGADFGSTSSFEGRAYPFTCGGCGTMLIESGGELIRYEESSE